MPSICKTRKCAHSEVFGNIIQIQALVFYIPPRAAAKHAAGGASAKNCKAYRLRRRSNYPRDELPEIAKRRCNRMSTNSNNLVNPNAREAMNRFKMEAASEVGVY